MIRNEHPGGIAFAGGGFDGPREFTAEDSDSRDRSLFTRTRRLSTSSHRRTSTRPGFVVTPARWIGMLLEYDMRWVYKLEIERIGYNGQ